MFPWNMGAKSPGKDATMKAEIKQESGYWSVYYLGRLQVDRESFAVADRVAYYLNNPDKWSYSEASSVADAIRRSA